MKHLDLLTLALASLLGVGSLCAQNRSAAEMESIASRFFQTSVRRAPGRTVSSAGTPSVTAVGTAAAYRVYAPVEGEGFVIVSTDCQQPAVLGFAESGNFASDEMPPAMNAFLQGTAANAEGEHLITRAESEVEPLLGDIEFNQRAPFNNLCPLYNGERTLTGCVATAMSQVMYFYRYPSTMTGEAISYTTASNEISVTWTPTETTFDWDNILPHYGSADTPYDGGETLGTAVFFTAEGLSVNDEGRVAVAQLRNVSGDVFSGAVRLFLATSGNEFICPVGKSKNINALGANFYYSSYSLTHYLPSTVTDGTYRLYVATQATGSSEWSIVHTSNTTVSSPFDNAPYIEVTRSGRTYTIDNQTFEVNYSATQAEAVAKVHAASGAAIAADYGTSATSASSSKMLMALYENFGFDDGMAYVGADNYPSTAKVEEALIAEIQAGRPVLAGGNSLSGAHEYVVDGVKSIDDVPYFHFNWGWGGTDNGWFLLNLDGEQEADGVATNEYCYDFDFMLGCKPSDGAESPYTFGGKALSVDAAQYMPGDPLTLTATNLFNRSTRAFSGVVNAYLIAEEGEGETLLGSFAGLTELSPNYGFKEYNRSYTLPETLSSGRYTIELRPQAEGMTQEGVALFGSQPQFRVGEEVTTIEVPVNPATGVATFYWDSPATIPTEVNVFAGTLSDDNSVFTLSQINTGVIPANTGVILSAPGQTTVTFEAASAAATIQSDLTGSLADVATVDVAGTEKVVWVISSKEDGSDFGFYKYVGETIKANRAYLLLSNAVNAPVVRFTYGTEEGNVSGIESLKADTQSASSLYDLQGCRVTDAVRPGLYIRGGKKVLVK